MDEQTKEFLEHISDALHAIELCAAVTHKTIQKKLRQERPTQTDLDWHGVPAIYNRETNTFTIDIAEDDVDPKFLKYVLKHLEIPTDAKIIFTKN